MFNVLYLAPNLNLGKYWKKQFWGGRLLYLYFYFWLVAYSRRLVIEALRKL